MDVLLAGPGAWEGGPHGSGRALLGEPTLMPDTSLALSLAIAELAAGLAARVPVGVATAAATDIVVVV